MRTALFVFVAIVLGTGIMLGHDFIRAEFMPGTHILYLGFRDFHIWYRYVDPKRYSFINEELDDKIKYYFKKVVDHIILYDMHFQTNGSFCPDPVYPPHSPYP